MSAAGAAKGMSGAIARSRGAALALLAIFACVLLAPGAALAQEPRATLVQRVARDWLALIDKLDAEGSWKAAGVRMQRANPPAEWVESLRTERVPRGELVQRAVAATTFTDTIPGLPEGGNYAVVRFQSSFANQTEGVEAVTLEVGADYAWHVIGYAIQ
jgi:hypothetical protein